MNKQQAHIVSTLLEWKIDVEGLNQLKEVKGELETAEGLEYLKMIYDVLGLERVFKELSLEEPTFEKDKELTESVKKIDKSMFRWL